MKNPAVSYRSGTIGRETLSINDRTVSLSFSSEAPVSRWNGDEILLHGRGNADLTRLTTVGAVLFGHQAGDINRIIGRVNAASIDTARRRGMATIRFDDDASGAKALAKVSCGSLRGVSFGYSIHEAVRIDDGERWTDPEGRTFAGPALIGTKWEAYEISLTPIPADPSVGIGRDLTRDLSGIKILKAKEYQEMPNKPIPTEILEEILDRAAAAGPECRATVADMITKGATEGELWIKILDALGVTAKARKPKARYAKFSDIPNDVLANFFKYPDRGEFDHASTNTRKPTTQPAATPLSRTGARKLSDISDEALAFALKNPFYIY